MENETRGNSGSRWWAPLVEFLTHTLVGVGIFVIIGASAVSLSFAIRWLEGHGASIYILVGLQIVEYSLFTADVLLFLIFLSRAAYRAARKL